MKYFSWYMEGSTLVMRILVPLELMIVGTLRRKNCGVWITGESAFLAVPKLDCLVMGRMVVYSIYVSMFTYIYTFVYIYMYV